MEVLNSPTTPPDPSEVKAKSNSTPISEVRTISLITASLANICNLLQRAHCIGSRGVHTGHRTNFG